MQLYDTRGWPTDEQVDRKQPETIQQIARFGAQRLPEGVDERMLPELPIDQRSPHRRIDPPRSPPRVSARRAIGFGVGPRQDYRHQCHLDSTVGRSALDSAEGARGSQMRGRDWDW